MSTICKICIKADEESVSKPLLSFFEIDEETITEETSQWPLTTEASNFENGDDFPTIFSLKQVTDQVTEIHYNSFSKVEELTRYLTKQLATKAVINIYQSTAEGCYWAYYLQGELLREIEYADSECYQNNGIKLDFEGDDLGHDIADDGEESLYVYGYQDMEHYNHSVGIEIQLYQEYKENWKNIKLGFYQQEKSKVLNKKTQPNQKPWWKFWK